MTSKTATVILPAPRETVFAYLADIKNLPRWATEFCKELNVVNGEHRVVTDTPQGRAELHAHYDVDERTGVIDMYAGPTADQSARYPTRVVDLPGNRSAFIFTLFQGPEDSDEWFEAQYESLRRKLDNIRNIFAAEEQKARVDET